MAYLDRFIIGAIVSASAVAYYVTPNELITKLWIVPGALTAVLFPTFAAQIVECSDEASILYKRVLYWLYLTMLPITLGTALFAELILSLWINKEFAQQSYQLLQIFSFGMFITCLANVPFTLLQSADKARTTAMIHLVEFPIYIGILWILTANYSVVGAAIAWLIRIALDAAFMFAAANYLFNGVLIARKKLWSIVVPIAGGVIGFSGVFLEDNNKIAIWMMIVIGVVLLILYKTKNIIFFKISAAK
jgi:O-antigen/teichoic acid export membrane protein